MLALLAQAALMLAGGVPEAAACLVRTYPEVVCGFEAPNTLVLCDGARIPRDDGREKTIDERFESPDPEDMFVWVYGPAADDRFWPPAPTTDPGRIRFERLFEAAYGDSPAAVTAQLAPVRWFGRTVRVSRRNGVATRLKAVAADLARLPRKFHRYFTHTSGTYNWRSIKGSSVRSLHSYGIAIDVGIEHSNYWRWVPGASRAADPPPYENRFPREVVEVFERHGFIWGGRWAHFDTMHFEYRPELLCVRPKAP
jgi:hypothetical protein